MNKTLEVLTTLITINCGECGGVYAVSQRFYDKCREKGGDWHCPYPECRTGWGFSGRGENAKLKDQLEKANRRAASANCKAENAEYRRRAAVGQVTKIKNRISKGVCPCCNRTFANLARHMESQHPDYPE